MKGVQKDLVNVQVGTGEGHVVVLFAEPVGWMALEPGQARSLAMTLWRLARELDLQNREGIPGPGTGDERC